MPVWALCAAASFSWPGEVEKAMERVSANPWAVTQQDIQILKDARTPEAAGHLMKLMGSESAGTAVQAARALAELSRSTWSASPDLSGTMIEPTLVGWLDRPDAVWRIAACDLLGQLGATDQRDRVAMMITDADLDVRATCVRSLLALHLGSEQKGSIKNLTVQLLSDPYFEVRQQAVVGLGLLGEQETFVALLPLLESDSTLMRRLTLQALVSIDPGQAFSHVVEALEDTDYEVMATAVKLVGAIGDPVGVVHLRPLLGDMLLDMHVVAALSQLRCIEACEILVELLQVPRLRSAALNALASQGDDVAGVLADAISTTTDPEILRSLVKVAALHPDASYLPGLVRVLALAPERKLDVLDVLSGIEGREALLMALSLVQDSTPKTRVRALEVAGAILASTGRDPAADEVIVDSLCDQDLDVRLVALELVRRWRIDGAAKLLVGLIDSKHLAEVTAAAVALLSLGETYPVPKLVETLLDKDRVRARSAASALCDASPEAALDPLVDLVEDDVLVEHPPAGADLALDVLGRIMQRHSGPRAETLVADMLGSGDEGVRELGARAATLSGLHVFEGRLADMLISDRPHVRRAIAARLLAARGAAGADLQAEAMRDDDASVRALAVLSMAQGDAVADDRKVDLLFEALSDGDEIVRIDAAASLREHAPALAGRRDELCSLYDRSLSDLEMIAAMLLLADVGASCLQGRLERLVLVPGTGPRAIVLEAVTIGRSTGAVTLTERLRAGLGQCAALETSRHGALCEALLEDQPLVEPSCRDFGPAGAGLFVQPAIAGWGQMLPAQPAVARGGTDPAWPGWYSPDIVTLVSEDAPVVVVDGALTVRVALHESGLAYPLPPPLCSGYFAFGLLTF